MILPDELMVMIFDKLPIAYHKICNQVCHGWNEIISYYFKENMTTHYMALCTFLIMDDRKNVERNIKGADRHNADYLKYAVRSGSRYLVIKLLRLGFNCKGVIETAIQYGHNDLFMELWFHRIEEMEFDRIVHLCRKYNNQILLEKCNVTKNIPSVLETAIQIKDDDTFMYLWFKRTLTKNIYHFIWDNAVYQSNNKYEVIKLCVQYGNITLLEKFYSFHIKKPDLELIRSIIKYDNLESFQWAVPFYTSKRKCMDRIETLIAQYGGTNIVKDLYQKLMKNQDKIVHLYREAIDYRNDVFLHCLLDWIMEHYPEMIINCNYMVTVALKYQHEKFLDMYINKSANLNPKIDFYELVKSNINIEKLLSYLPYCDTSKWNAKQMNHLLQRENTDLLRYAKDKQLAYEPIDLDEISISIRPWVLQNGYPIIIPITLLNCPDIRKIYREMTNAGASYVYTDTINFWSYLKINIKGLPKINFLLKILVSIDNESDREIASVIVFNILTELDPTLTALNLIFLCRDKDHQEFILEKCETYFKMDYLRILIIKYQK